MSMTRWPFYTPQLTSSRFLWERLRHDRGPLLGCLSSVFFRRGYRGLLTQPQTASTLVTPTGTKCDRCRLIVDGWSYNYWWLHLTEKSVPPDKGDGRAFTVPVLVTMVIWSLLQELSLIVPAWSLPVV
jgi:hypothetical protein